MDTRRFTIPVPRAALLRFLKTLLVLAVVYVLLHPAGFHGLLVNDSEGVGVLLQIVATLYSVLYAFATYVIWGQFTAVESEILKETSALQDLVRVWCTGDCLRLPTRRASTAENG